MTEDKYVRRIAANIKGSNTFQNAASYRKVDIGGGNTILALDAPSTIYKMVSNYAGWAEFRINKFGIGLESLQLVKLDFPTGTAAQCYAPWIVGPPGSPLQFDGQFVGRPAGRSFVYPWLFAYVQHTRTSSSGTTPEVYQAWYTQRIANYDRFFRFAQPGGLSPSSLQTTWSSFLADAYVGSYTSPTAAPRGFALSAPILVGGSTVVNLPFDYTVSIGKKGGVQLVVSPPLVPANYGSFSNWTMEFGIGVLMDYADAAFPIGRGLPFSPSVPANVTFENSYQSQELAPILLTTLTGAQSEQQLSGRLVKLQPYDGFSLQSSSLSYIRSSTDYALGEAMIVFSNDTRPDNAMTLFIGTDISCRSDFPGISGLPPIARNLGMQVDLMARAKPNSSITLTPINSMGNPYEHLFFMNKGQPGFTPLNDPIEISDNGDGLVLLTFTLDDSGAIKFRDSDALPDDQYQIDLGGGSQVVESIRVRMVDLNTGDILPWSLEASFELLMRFSA